MADWRNRSGLLLATLLGPLLLLACTSEPSAVVIEDPTEALDVAATNLTPFGERLYGSTWEVIQAQRNGEALVEHFKSPVELGGFSFYGTRKELAVSVQHPCGSATAPIEVTNDRIVTDDFAVPLRCAGITVFELFAQPKIAAAFNGPRLELTGDNASLAAEHFLSTSDNGTAPLYVLGDPYVEYQVIQFEDPASSSADSPDRTFEILVHGADQYCGEPSGVLLEPDIRYAANAIHIAMPAVSGPLDAQPAERLGICYGPGSVVVSLDEPRNGRPILTEEPPTRPATADEIEAANAALDERHRSSSR